MEQVHTNKQVLVVHDNTILRDHICSILTLSKAFNCLTSKGDIDDVMVKAKQGKPSILLLNPMRTPMSPKRLVQRIQSVHRGCNFVGYLPTDRSDFALECLRHGFSGVISQERSAQELLQAVQCIGDGGVFLDRGFASRGDDNETNSVGGCGLTPRERTVLHSYARGLSVKEISRNLSLSPKTVTTHKARGSRKLGLTSRSEVFDYAMENDWLMAG